MLPKTFVKGFHNENDVKMMKYQPFGKTGMQVSRLSLGCGGFCNIYGEFTLEQCKETVLQGLKSGINYIDTGPWYGQGVSETILGKCLDGIPREAYYVATKIGRYEKDPRKMFDFSPEKTRESLETSLKKLNVDYIDVIQMHDIEFAPSIDYLINETLPVLLEAKKAGKVKLIGVTGYPVSTLAEFVRKCPEIDMILSYSRLTLFEQELHTFQDDFMNVAVVNAAVLGMGLLTSSGPQSWHPAHQCIKEACKGAADYCQKNDVDISKLALSFAFDNYGDTVLNGMNNPELLKSSLKVLQEGLTPKELQIQADIKKMYFDPLSIRNWENVEINAFKKFLE
ncbi:uncharacterized protein [Atheta coriaria]|uniref:uncharacterized protein n=1 Tax=Dalotia coriaria TaxID=877792 RepID=UPI0031F39D16